MMCKNAETFTKEDLVAYKYNFLKSLYSFVIVVIYYFI